MARETTAEPESPDRLGAFELLREVAGSAVATTWIARPVAADGEPSRELVSLLRVHRHVLKGEAAEAFLDEARSAQRLRNQNVVPVLDVGIAGGEAFVASEHIEGESLAALVASAGPDGLPVPVVLRIGLDILEAVSAAHALAPEPLLHGELTPHHVRVGADGVTRVAGFGVARALARLGAHGVKNHDRLAYAAPERVKAMATPGSSAAPLPLDPRADVFSVAVMLWECIARQRLFASKMEAAVIQKVLTAPVSSLTAIARVELPPEVDEAVLRGLERDPARRFARADDFIFALEGAGPENIASSERVAAVVEQLAGAHMAARRAEIEAAMAGQGAAVPAPSPSGSGIPRPARASTLLGVAPPSSARTSAPPSAGEPRTGAASRPARPRWPSWFPPDDGWDLPDAPPADAPAIEPAAAVTSSPLEESRHEAEGKALSVDEPARAPDAGASPEASDTTADTSDAPPEPALTAKEAKDATDATDLNADATPEAASVPPDPRASTPGARARVRSSEARIAARVRSREARSDRPLLKLPPFPGRATPSVDPGRFRSEPPPRRGPGLPPSRRLIGGSVPPPLGRALPLPRPLPRPPVPPPSPASPEAMPGGSRTEDRAPEAPRAPLAARPAPPARPAVPPPAPPAPPKPAPRSDTADAPSWTADSLSPPSGSTTPEARARLRELLERFQPGSALGPYEVLLPVAKGGMACVWAARPRGARGSEKLVAIKTMLPSLSDDPELVSMFLAEARVASRIRHPNVIEVIEAGEHDGLLYLAMEWIEGETLSRLERAARPNGGIPLPIALRIVSQVCAGLHAAHELRDDEGALVDLVHRDVSPANVLVSSSGLVKVVDFGVAKSRLADHVTGGGRIVKGKTPYLSPEQIDARRVDRRSDLFSLGALLYFLASGEHPFRGESDVETAENILSRDPAPLRERAPAVPEEVDAIVRQALRKDPDERFATAAGMQRAIDRAASALGAAATDDDVAAFVASVAGDTQGRRTAELRNVIAWLDGAAAGSEGAEAAQPEKASAKAPEATEDATTRASETSAIEAPAAGREPLPASAGAPSATAGEATSEPPIFIEAIESVPPSATPISLGPDALVPTDEDAPAKADAAKPPTEASAPAEREGERDGALAPSDAEPPPSPALERPPPPAPSQSQHGADGPQPARRSEPRRSIGPASRSKPGASHGSAEPARPKVASVDLDATLHGAAMRELVGRSRRRTVKLVIGVAAALGFVVLVNASIDRGADVADDAATNAQPSREPTPVARGDRARGGLPEARRDERADRATTSTSPDDSSAGTATSASEGAEAARSGDALTSARGGSPDDSSGPSTPGAALKASGAPKGPTAAAGPAPRPRAGGVAPAGAPPKPKPVTGPTSPKAAPAGKKLTAPARSAPSAAPKAAPPSAPPDGKPKKYNPTSI